MSLACVTPCSALRPAATASSSLRSAQLQQRAASMAPLLPGWRRQRRRQAAVRATEEGALREGRLSHAVQWMSIDNLTKCRPLTSCCPTPADLDQQLQADLERLRQRQAAAGGGAPQAASPARQQQQQQAASSASGGDSPLAGLKDAVDKVR